MIRMLRAVLVLAAGTAAAASGGGDPLQVVVPRQIRRVLNLGSLFGSATHSATPYERVGGHPVFAVTTSWGSPYMNMEPLTTTGALAEAAAATAAGRDRPGKPPASGVKLDAPQYRTVCVYYMDPDEALGAQEEMRQMENMRTADVRLTAFSLARALRQASHLSGGLLTGQPPDQLTGILPRDSGALRYKIVPPRRQLYYAARCRGRERVGLSAPEATTDARNVVVGVRPMKSGNAKPKLGRTGADGEQDVRMSLKDANAHMDGYYGIPVFWNPQMQRKLPLLKRLTTGVQYEIPMFFNYEDMEGAWQTLRLRNKKKGIPEQPEGVEVFNLMDLLTSMDRDACARRQKAKLVDRLVEPFRNRFVSQSGPDLRHVTFVPSSRSIQYKEAISARGNGKCRLRPMR